MLNTLSLLYSNPQLECRLEPADIRLAPPSAEHFHADLQALFVAGALWPGVFACGRGTPPPVCLGSSKSRVLCAGWFGCCAEHALLHALLLLPTGAGIKQRVEKRREVVEREVTTFQPRTDHSLCQRFH